MRRVLGLATGLALTSTALVPAAPAAAAPPGAAYSAAACRTAAVECERDPLIAVAVKVRATPAARPGGKVTYVVDYSQTWTPSFAPYWGAFWVGGRFPAGARGPARAVLYDTAGKRLAVLPCHRYADGTWCDAHGRMPHQGRIAMAARLPSDAKGKATARLGFNSFETLNEAEYARHHGRKKLREKFCEFRFTRTAVTRVSTG
ncbi:hypothetical protein [Planomonospora venezuelensis]|uniref:Uncharacterized protein n=1 Tax=Planomonospora venezuelensis TaxID=1999 RepID=A0A841DBJ7_PLAVE|nr:hypothetical protein [Planomonospora venezuelensis]MBB5966137.1 hypothetical protein [Planomonospora venezuelensis]GIN04614.1 hypothetical protein Pve01_62720 [Planomonospora venezuelensis]